MSTNHNRIKVSDLERNERDKILKTNLDGELEFCDVSNLKTENYNDLDCNTEGKALDARQGKVLKDMIDNFNTVSFVSKEDISNKSSNIINDSSSNTKYPSVKAVFSWVLENFRLKGQNITQSVNTTYTLQFGDINETIVFSSDVPSTFVIPLQDSVSFETGHTVKFIQTGDGPVTIAGAGINFITNQSLTSTKGETRTLTRLGKNIWSIEGQVSLEKDVKLKSFPSTRNDGILSTNKVLSTDENGNLKLYTMNSISDDIKATLINDLTTGGTSKALTAEMGKALKDLVDNLGLAVSNKVDLVNGKVPQFQSQGSNLSYNPVKGIVTLTDARAETHTITLPPPSQSFKYKYSALITQSDTSDPTVSIIKNSFPIDLVWKRKATGVYEGTFIEYDFILDSMACLNNHTVPGFIEFSQNQSETVLLKTFDITGTLADDLLVNNTISIEV